MAREVVQGDSGTFIGVAGEKTTVITHGNPQRGADGRQGNQGNAGAGIPYRGEWVSTTAYSYGDAVHYNRSLYICIQPNTGVEPTNSAFWGPGALEGEKGNDGAAGGAVGSSNWTPKGNWTIGDTYTYGDVVYLSTDYDNGGGSWVKRSAGSHTASLTNRPGLTTDWARVASRGRTGQIGPKPVLTIGANGNWYVDGQDTGKPSRGAVGGDGTDGRDGRDGTNGTNGKDGTNGTNGTDAPVSYSITFYQDGSYSQLFTTPFTLTGEVTYGTGTRGTITVNGVNPGSFPIQVPASPTNPQRVTVFASGTTAAGFLVNFYGAWGV